MQRTQRILFGALVTVLCLGPAALAVGAPAPQPTSLTLATNVLAGGEVSVSARLTDAAGKAVGNQPLHFTIMADFMGKQAVPIDTGVTDTTGTASVTYTPIWVGAHEFRASFAGTSAFQEGKGSTSIQLSTAAPVYKPTNPELTLIRKVMAAASVTILLTVWATILGVMVRVGIGLGRTRTAEAGAAPGWEKTEPIGFGKG